MSGLQVPADGEKHRPRSSREEGHFEIVIAQDTLSHVVEATGQVVHDLFRRTLSGRIRVRKAADQPAT
jgi:hypothetical protein